MSNILIVNAGKVFAHSKGELNTSLASLADEHLRAAGHNVRVTHVDQGYDIETEIQNYLWADTVIYQMPGWWMDVPWILKKYVDEIFTEGHGACMQVMAAAAQTRLKNMALVA